MFELLSGVLHRKVFVWTHLQIILYDCLIKSERCESTLFLL